MKQHLIFFLFLLIAFSACSQQSVDMPAIEYNKIALEEFQQLNNYDQIVNLLKSENRIDTTDATFIKMVSSNGFVAFEQTPDSIVAENGKFEVGDVELVLKASFQDEELLLIVTVYKGFCHAFKYLPTLNMLERFENIRSVSILSVDKLKIYGSNSSGISFYAENEYMTAEDWVMYFFLDLEASTFAHTQNCRTIHQKRECNKVELINIKGIK
ncbi:MAG: hypothetical protein K9H64_12180 [Bacteroidales bacterium]|nr:hypothetical protein [Bacteroidales bacterium]MCF8456796.1 hypothetical protein [Bacteroidales bacterium]